MIVQVTMYKVVCDAAGCTFQTSDISSEYEAWSDAGHAEDEWRDSDNQATEDGKHFCEKHGVPVCCHCGSTKVVINDEPDGSGDWYCATHREDQ